MSKRSERREADRIARKLAYQQSRQSAAQPEPFNPETAAEPTPATTPATTPVSEAQLAANRANSRHSTGPVTPEGRAKSSKNALKHGLSGKTVLLPDEDPADYQRELDVTLQHFQPVGTYELRLVQGIVDCQWRLNRIQLLETSIVYKAQIEIAEKHQDRPATERRHFVHAEAYLAYEKPLRNLYIQEARIRRSMEKYAAELKQLQTGRENAETDQAKQPIGFEYSNPKPAPQPQPAGVDQTPSSPPIARHAS